MSFAEHLLDSYDALEKKTSVSISGLKGLSSFMKHLGEVFKKCSSETQGVCSKYKMKENSNLEGSIKATIIALITEIETTVISPFSSLASECERSVKEYESFIKEHEQMRKKLFSDASHIQKEWDSAQSALKKAKETYFKCAKEAASAQAASVKAQEKNAAVAKQKADSAGDKARAADDGYGALLVKTNDFQRRYYSETQPELLNRFQKWEEERMSFVQSQIIAFSDCVAAQELPSKWDHFATGIKECGQAINVESDLEGYARAISNKVSVPDDIPYEPAPVGPTNGGPESLSTGGSSRPASRATTTTTSTTTRSAAAQQPTNNGEDGERHKALFEYSAVNDGELSLKEGQFVMITEKDPSGWWYAVAEDGKEGFVPSSYVEPV